MVSRLILYRSESIFILSLSERDGKTHPQGVLRLLEEHHSNVRLWPSRQRLLLCGVVRLARFRCRQRDGSARYSKLAQPDPRHHAGFVRKATMNSVVGEAINEKGKICGFGLQVLLEVKNPAGFLYRVRS